MGIIDLIFCPAAVIIALLAVIKGKGRYNIFGVMSYVCAALPMLMSFYDIMDRIKDNDISGIMDIYPFMVVVFSVVFGVVTLLNLLALRIHRGRKEK